ncbi:MAG: hypothetical protein H7Y04_15210 [Verrucomicrobia bacterium]|nr:hypothetical protein [Cytophagales bacterium]
MNTIHDTHKSSLAFKIITCLLAAIGLFNILLMGLEILPKEWLAALENTESLILGGQVVLGVLLALGYSFWWQQQEKQSKGNSGLKTAYLQGFIRYWLAFEIATYGFAKIFKTQFQTPDYRLDMPLGDISGFGLTWYYFGYSYLMAVIIAIFQIGGSILLLYRRTTLLGTIILLPVLFNILLINVFYDIAVGAFINSMLFLLGLTYFLLLDFQKLKTVFWDLVERLPPIQFGLGKHFLRFLPILGAFGFIFYLVNLRTSDTELIGTWEVKKFVRNKEIVSASAWLQDTTVISRVYFSGFFGCAFSPNPQLYRPKQALRGDYEFDKKNNKLKFKYWTASSEKPDSLLATISNRTDKSMVLEGILRKDTIHLELAKLERKKK